MSSERYNLDVQLLDTAQNHVKLEQLLLPHYYTKESPWPRRI